MQPSLLQAHLITWDVARACFDQLSSTFEVARAEHPDEYQESLYTMAGKTVRLRIVGRALAALYQRALAARIAPTTPALTLAHAPALTIDLWDESVTQVHYPLPVAQAHRGRRTIADRQLLSNDETWRWVWAEKGDSATWLDRKDKRMIGWRAQGAQIPLHERSKPLSFLLPLCFYDQGIHILHAGMVAREGAGILVAGGSGVGKTTTTLACLLAGFDYLGDDQVAVTHSGAGRFVAHSIFQSARILPDHLDHFPALQSHAILSETPLDPKALIFLAECFPERVCSQAEVHAITLPRLSGQPQTELRRASRAEALHYMARTSLLTPFGLGRARSHHLLQLLGSAPCYWLDLGHELSAIPTAVEQLLAEAR